MVVFKIHVIHFPVIELKGNAPVGTNCDTPCAFAIPFEFMEMPAVNVHILDDFGRLQLCEDMSDPWDHLLRKASRIIVFKKPLEASVQKTLDHPSTVKCSATLVNKKAAQVKRRAASQDFCWQGEQGALHSKVTQMLILFICVFCDIMMEIHH